MLGSKKTDQVDSFIYLGSIISKDGGCREDIKNRIAKDHGVFSQSKKVWKNRKISLRTRIRILGATVVKCGREPWAFQKMEKDVLDVFQRN